MNLGVVNKKVAVKTRVDVINLLVGKKEEKILKICFRNNQRTYSTLA